MNMFKGRVVANQSHYIAAGNTWISDVVYQIEKNYFVKKVLVENLSAGPREIGEEVDVYYEESDPLAEDWMIAIYKNPKSYKKEMLVKKNKDKQKLEEVTNIQEEKKNNPILNVIIALLLIAIIGALLWIVIKG